MVLIIHTVKKKSVAISDIFYYMGVLSYAVTPTEALAEISAIYRAVLIIDPENLPDNSSFIEKLRSYNTNIPVFAISDFPDECEAESFDGIFPSNIYSSKLIEEIARHQKKHDLPIISQYKLAGIDASCDKVRISVFDDHLNFTKTETMILRYLIASYPTPQDTKSILRYSFKPLRKPEETGIRTHICVMNRKFREIRGRNLFTAIEGKGYVISTPEIVKSIKDAELITV